MQGVSGADREVLDAAVLCGHLVPAGSVYALLAQHRRALFPDEAFADLFPSGRGRPSVPADVIAVVMVLKELEGLADRQPPVDPAACPRHPGRPSLKDEPGRGDRQAAPRAPTLITPDGAGVGYGRGAP